MSLGRGQDCWVEAGLWLLWCGTDDEGRPSPTTSQPPDHADQRENEELGPRQMLLPTMCGSLTNGSTQNFPLQRGHVGTWNVSFGVIHETWIGIRRISFRCKKKKKKKEDENENENDLKSIRSHLYQSYRLHGAADFGEPLTAVLWTLSSRCSITSPFWCSRSPPGKPSSGSRNSSNSRRANP